MLTPTTHTVITATVRMIDTNDYRVSHNGTAVVVTATSHAAAVERVMGRAMRLLQMRDHGLIDFFAEI